MTLNPTENQENDRAQIISTLVEEAAQQAIGYKREKDDPNSRFELISSTGKKITYFGSHHVYEYDDPEIAQLEELLPKTFDSKNTESCAVILESPRPLQLPYPRDITESGIVAGGEAEFAYLKARQQGITSHCFEPPLSDQINFAAQKCDRDLVFLLFVGRAVINFSTEAPNNLGLREFMRPQLTRFQNESGWTDFDLTFDNLESIYRKLTGRNFTPQEKRQFTKMYDPTKDESPLNEVGRLVHIYRDTQVVIGTDALLKSGKTDLLFVYGNGHALTQRNALKYILEN